MMKRAISVLLAVLVLATLCACGSAKKAPENSDPAAPAADRPLAFQSSCSLGGNAEVTLLRAFASHTVQPPIMNGFWSIVDAATSGNIFVIVSAKVKNLGTKDAALADLLEASIKPEAGGTPVIATAYMITEHGTHYEGNPAIAAKSTELCYFAFSVAEGRENNAYTLTLTTPDGSAKDVTFCAKDFSNSSISVGQTVSDDTEELTLDKVYYSTKLSATNSDFYMEADEGNIFFIVKVTAKNLSNSELTYASLAGVRCVFNETEEYPGACLFEENDGTRLSHFPGQSSLAPEDTGVCYYVFEVPEGLQNAPKIVTLYAAGEFFTVSVS